MGVGANLGNESGILVQSYVALLLESEMKAGFNYKNWIILILNLLSEHVLVAQ